VVDIGVRSGLVPTGRSTLAAALAGLGLVLAPLAFSSAAPAQADAVAYLVNVTVRPGYHFANADAALAYGYATCDKIAAGRDYTAIIGDIENDFGTADEYQASYLISQAANELCPALIWQLRNSAAHHRASAP
jgi:hypothetical protein